MEYNAFIAEGDKIAAEWLLSRAAIQVVVALPEWIEAHKASIADHPEAVVHEVPDSVLGQLSALQTPNKVLLVVSMPAITKTLPENEWCIALDNIQDPGNMGTIIRIADWFGIDHIICSPDCVDVYNPKVVQAAMGGHLRVQLHKADLQEYLTQCNMPVIAAALDGENIYSLPRMDKGVLVIGNESKGISEALLAKATHKVLIPGKGGAESLNAAVSTGIICALLLPLN